MPVFVPVLRVQNGRLESAFVALLERLQPDVAYMRLFREIVLDAWKDRQVGVTRMRKAVEREYPHAVRPPHHVGRLGDDLPVVGLRGALTPAVRGEQSVRPHDAQHPRAGDSDPIQDPKPGVDLAMAFAVERGPSEIALVDADLPQ